MFSQEFPMRPLLAALAIAIAGLGAAPASAEIVYVTVVGTVHSSYGFIDTAGLFGAAGANLSGDAFTEQYEFNTSLGETGSSATSNYAYGGSFYAVDGAPYTTSPSLGASITINGRSVSLAGTGVGFIEGANTGSYSESYALVQDLDGYIEADLVGYPGNSPGSITTPYSIGTVGDSYALGSFAFGGTSLFLDLTNYALSLSDPTTVPEPASLALLGIGLIGTGVVVRRRRGSAAMPIAN